MAKLMDARVMISDLDPAKLSFAKELGADEVVNVNEQDLLEAVNQWTDGVGVNVSIDAVCIPLTFKQSIDAVSVAGRVVVLSFGEEAIELAPPLPITKKELSIKSSRLQTFQFENVVKLVDAGKLQHQGLITHTSHYMKQKKPLNI